MKEEELNKICRKIRYTLWCFLDIFTMLLAMVISSIVGFSLKPIVFELNSILGEGYAIFASYMLAICFFVLLRNGTYIDLVKKKKELLK